MRKSQTGFTIVELLVVIVVVAILAVVSAVAYTGIQQRARDTQRLNDIRQIRRALEAYRVAHDRYPPTSPNTDSNNTCGSGHTNGYSYSTSTNGRWIAALVSSGIVASVPTAPGNDCNSFYRYLNVSDSRYGCTERTTGYSVLQVYGVEGMVRPSDAVSAIWSPCVGSTASWSSTDTHWTFILEG